MYGNKRLTALKVIQFRQFICSGKTYYHMYGLTSLCQDLQCVFHFLSFQLSPTTVPLIPANPSRDFLLIRSTPSMDPTRFLMMLFLPILSEDSPVLRLNGSINRLRFWIEDLESSKSECHLAN